MVLTFENKIHFDKKKPEISIRSHFNFLFKKIIKHRENLLLNQHSGQGTISI